MKFIYLEKKSRSIHDKSRGTTIHLDEENAMFTELQVKSATTHKDKSIDYTEDNGRINKHYGGVNALNQSVEQSSVKRNRINENTTADNMEYIGLLEIPLEDNQSIQGKNKIENNKDMENNACFNMQYVDIINVPSNRSDANHFSNDGYR